MQTRIKVGSVAINFKFKALTWSMFHGLCAV